MSADELVGLRQRIDVDVATARNNEDELVALRRRADDERIIDREHLLELVKTVYIVNERMIQHMDESKSWQNKMEILVDRVTKLEKTTDEVCAVCRIGQKVLWMVGTGGVIVVWWLVQRYLEKVHGV